ncbi:MAG: hypothetical protein N4A72_02315 [Bacteroidales bacterium]|jgi:hypothetical protein|nr:hypothetical protein [Bacteroidales bacterium]
MSKDETIYDKIQSVIGNLNGKLNILEEEISVDIQLQYFELSKKMKRENSYVDTDKCIKILNSKRSKEQDIKLALISLSIIDNVEVMRAMENYLEEVEGVLRKWAIIAFQENRMLIESSLLEQNQIFITTGLGGKGNKLRYFLLVRVNIDELSDAQKKLITEEFTEIFKQFDSEIEELYFDKKEYFTLTCLIPMKVPIKRVFTLCIAQCNDYGKILNPEFLVTNVKKPTAEEIESHFKDKQRR